MQKNLCRLSDRDFDYLFLLANYIVPNTNFAMKSRAMIVTGMSFLVYLPVQRVIRT